MCYKVFVGIDISKDSFSVCALDSKQKVFFESSFPMNQKGFQGLIEKLKPFKKDSVLIGKESTGCYHINLFAFLSKKGFQCVVLNPLLVSNFIKLSLRKTKTDRTDAKNIASMLSLIHEKLPKESFISQEFKELARERERIVKQIAKLKNDIEKLCVVLFPELERRVNIYSAGILRLLENFPSARLIDKASVDEIKQALASKKEGRTVAISPQEIKKLAKNSIAQFFPARELILSCKIKELSFLNQTLDSINKLLKEVCEKGSKSQNIDILTSIKGVGTISAIHFLAEIGDIFRFSSYKKLIAYCGLDPSVCQSGKFMGKSKISKRGNRHLRRIIYLMTVSVVRFNPFFKCYFNKRKKEGLPYRKAILATAHKLLRTIFAMLSNMQRFSPSYYHHYTQEVNL